MSLSIYQTSAKQHYKNYLLLLIICFLAYWPLSLGMFSVKNDAIHYFLPYRFHISEALRNGEFPFWSPYIYMGYPIQGDMQSGAWNPVVWLFSAIGRYDITLFHFENLLYIFLGGVGMYKLTHRITDHSTTALLIGVSYMLSGFMLGGQLINWLSAAAFIPFVIHYYLHTLQKTSISCAIKTGIALFFLFTSSYPSFTILTLYLLFIIFIVDMFNKYSNKKQPFTPWKSLLPSVILLLVFTGLSLPALTSYIDLLPFYQRGSGASYDAVVSNSFEIQHSLSLIFPSTIKANDIVSSTDVTCRNIYMGLFPLVILLAIPLKWSRRNILLMLLAIFSLLFSLGDTTPVRKLCYQFVPLMDTFRHPSQMRLFLILSLLLLIAPGLKRILTGESDDIYRKRIKVILWIMLGVLIVAGSIALFQSELWDKIDSNSSISFRDFIKNILESMSIADAIAINASIQIPFVLAHLLIVRKTKNRNLYFSLLWILNLFLMAQLVLPATFVSRVNPKEINAIIHQSQKGYPVDNLQNSIAANSKDAFDNYEIAGLAFFYNKKIGLTKITNSPAFLDQQDKFSQTRLLYQYVASQPVAYIADSILPLKDTALLQQTSDCHYAFSDDLLNTTFNCNTNNKVTINKLSANSFEIESLTDSGGLLVLSQNFHPNWKVSINDKPGNIIKTNMSFMGTLIPAGKQQVRFSFVPVNTIIALWAQLIVLVALLLYGIILFFNQGKNKI